MVVRAEDGDRLYRSLVMHAKTSLRLHPIFLSQYLIRLTHPTNSRTARRKKKTSKSNLRSAAATMPKSKRARVVHTSQVQKKASKEKSAALFAAVQQAAEAHAHAFVFGVENMRNTYLKDVRQHFGGDGRLFFGKTKVMAKALGAGVEDEVMPGLSGLGAWLRGSVGLLFTGRDVQVCVLLLGWG